MIDWAMRQLLLLPGAPTQTAQADTFKQALDRILARVGQQRFEVAIRRCVDECRFFPMPADVSERLPPAESTRFTSAPIQKLPPGERYYGLADLKELPAYKAIMAKLNGIQGKH